MPGLPAPNEKNIIEKVLEYTDDLKTSMFIYAHCALPVIFAQLAGQLNMWFAVLNIGFAAAGH